MGFEPRTNTDFKPGALIIRYLLIRCLLHDKKKRLEEYSHYHGLVRKDTANSKPTIQIEEGKGKET